jgi:tRNA(Ile2) C34 agmatinyltransferase TiaS
MSFQTRDAGFTLWELAEAVMDEVDRLIVEETVAQQTANAVLSHLLRAHVRNIRLVDDSVATAWVGDEIIDLC